MTVATPPDFAFRAEGDRPVLAVTGDWTVFTVGEIAERLLASPELSRAPRLDLSHIGAFDTSGAFVLDRALRVGDAETDPAERISADPQGFGEMFAAVRRASLKPEAPADMEHHGAFEFMARIGHGAVDAWKETLRTLAFVGEALTTLGRCLVNPGRMRWTSVVAIAEEAGLDALPIVAFLSFFVGMVVAFIGATALAELGASIFVVELVGISVLREFGVVITAVILAGRTNSAFTAQIGAMKMRQEIDALEVIGMKPMEVLVVPRLMAMLLMVPILTFVATVSGVLGGLVVSWAALDINPNFFLSRLLEGVPVQNLWVGLSKSPVVALIVAIIGCRQGLLVGNSVISLGRSTTASVVHAIFAIIVMDAMFALFYMELGI